MNNQQVREIAEAAFKACFADVEIVSVDVRPGFDHYDDPMVDVKIIYDGEVEQLGGDGMSDVQSEIFSKVWWDAEDSPGWPHLHFIAKSDIGQEDPATV